MSTKPRTRAKKLVVSETNENQKLTIPSAARDPKAKSAKRHNPDSIYAPSLLERKVTLPFRAVGSDLHRKLESILKSQYEGKCGPEGFIKPGSITIFSHSTGVLLAGKIEFTVGFECEVCKPVEGMNIMCIAKNITKAGIRAVSLEETSPVVIFIARDHHHMSEVFNNVKAEQKLAVRVIGQRYELNDKYISVIGQIIEQKTRYLNEKSGN